MNTVIENLLTRRSIRSFTDKKISKEDLEQIAETGIYAPSGHNYQTWKITVVTDTKKIQRLANLVGEKLGRKDYDMYQPQALILPSNDRKNPHAMEDNACALENMFLAAHSMGIGSVWINQLRDLCDDPEVRELLTQWQIPENHVIFGCGAFGYSAQEARGMVEKKGSIYFVD